MNMAKARRASDERADESQDTKAGAQALQDDASSADAPDHDLIARRAYERFQVRGGDHGRDRDDWLEAERELNKNRTE
jgi:hypothetical protein